MKKNTHSTWILMLISISLLVVVWYITVTSDILKNQNPDNNNIVLPEDLDDTLENNPDLFLNSQKKNEKTKTYTGTFPCADCPGIIMTLTIYPDKVYQLDRTYLDRDTSFSEKGAWKKAENPAKYILIDENQQYLILDDNTLEALDADGNRAESTLDYRLKRIQKI